LPGPQEELAQAILKEAKGPVILVLIAGGALDISNLLQDSRVPAVLFAGYPGT
jgi:beta-D-xylosidase 4